MFGFASVHRVQGLPFMGLGFRGFGVYRVQDLALSKLRAVGFSEDLHLGRLTELIVHHGRTRYAHGSEMRAGSLVLQSQEGAASELLVKACSYVVLSGGPFFLGLFFFLVFFFCLLVFLLRLPRKHYIPYI